MARAESHFTPAISREYKYSLVAGFAIITPRDQNARIKIVIRLGSRAARTYFHVTQMIVLVAIRSRFSSFLPFFLPPTFFFIARKRTRRVYARLSPASVMLQFPTRDSEIRAISDVAAPRPSAVPLSRNILEICEYNKLTDRIFRATFHPKPTRDLASPRDLLRARVVARKIRSPATSRVGIFNDRGARHPA